MNFETYALVLACAAAPFLGSFACLLGLRLPAGEGWVRGRSRCPACRRSLPLADTLPVFGWLYRRGRCRHCAAPIARVYPISEALALAAALYGAAAFPPAIALASLLLTTLLIAIAVADGRHGVIPDGLSAAVLVAGLATVAWTAPARLPAHALAVVAGFVALYLVAAGYRRLKDRPGLGLGDVKLFGAAGAWVGVAGLPSVLLSAAGIALAAVGVMRLGGAPIAATTALPFGPYLAVGIWTVWALGPLLPPV